MAWLILLAVSVLALGGMALFAPRAEAASSEAPDMPTLDDLFARFAEHLPPLPVDRAALLKAIAWQESRLNPEAVRNNPPRDVSVGLMQVLCIPDENGICANRFNIEGWPATFDALKNPETNLYYAVQILSYNFEQYGFPRGIAVYNAWSARNAPLEGPFPNQDYVDSVLTKTMEFSQ